MTQSVECLIEDERWDESALKAISAHALQIIFAHFNIENQSAELSILACDNARIAALNGAYRQKPVATNILAWPMVWHPRSAGALPDFSRPRPPELGDLALAYEVCAHEACEGGIAFEDHLKHLIVHGILHLLGFDHQNDADCAVMEAVEAVILQKMAVEGRYEKDPSYCNSAPSKSYVVEKGTNDA